MKGELRRIVSLRLWKQQYIAHKATMSIFNNLNYIKKERVRKMYTVVKTKMLLPGGVRNTKRFRPLDLDLLHLNRIVNYFILTYHLKHELETTRAKETVRSICAHVS